VGPIIAKRRIVGEVAGKIIAETGFLKA